MKRLILSAFLSLIFTSALAQSVSQGGPNITPQSVANLYNSYPINLPNFRSAIGNVRSGTADGKILIIGDSTSLGYGSNATTTSMRFNGYANLLATNLTNANITAEANGWLGDGNNYGTSSESSQYDSRITVGSGWSKLGITFPGGNSFTANSSTSALAFTPTVNVDTFIVTYLQFPSLGTFSYNLNGGSNTTLSTSGTSSFQTVKVTGSLQSNTLNLNYSSGGGVYILGIDAYNSASKQIHIINAGWSGTKSSSWSSIISGFGISNYYALGQGLTIIQLGINDMGSSVPVATFTANMQTLITACLAQGDVLLMTFEPDSTANVSAATQQQFQQAIITLASQNNIGVVDMYGRWVSYTLSNGLGMYYDTVHPNNIGYPDVAQSIVNVLKN